MSSHRGSGRGPLTFFAADGMLAGWTSNNSGRTSTEFRKNPSAVHTAGNTSCDVGFYAFYAVGEQVARNSSEGNLSLGFPDPISRRFPVNRASVRRLAHAGLLSFGVAVLGACSAETPAAPGLDAPSFGSIPGGTGVVTDNTLQPETFKVCKVYSGADAGPVTVQVQVDAGNDGAGAGDQNFNVNVAGGTCVAVWSTSGNNGVTDLVTVTETAPLGYTVTHVKQTNGDGGPTNSGTVASNTASSTITNPNGTGVDRVVVTFTNTQVATGALWLVIDEDGIDNGPRYWPNSATSFTSSTIKTWSTKDVNDDRPGLAQRLPLRWFVDPVNVGQTFWFFTGQVGDEAWFAPKFIPQSWADAGPDFSDGLRNFLGDPTQPFATPKHLVGPGLGTGNDPEKLLDKIPHVIPLRAEGLFGLIGKTVCALVWDSDINVNYDKPKPEGINGVLKGEKLGVVAFEVLNVVYLSGWSSSTLPRVQLIIRDPNLVCLGTLGLYLTAPEPKSSSEPRDIRPNNPVDNAGYGTF